MEWMHFLPGRLVGFWDWCSLQWIWFSFFTQIFWPNILNKTSNIGVASATPATPLATPLLSTTHEILLLSTFNKRFLLLWVLLLKFFFTYFCKITEMKNVWWCTISDFLKLGNFNNTIQYLGLRIIVQNPSNICIAIHYYEHFDPKFFVS